MKMPSNRFALDKRNAVLAGVCSGLAQRYGWHVGLVRGLTVLGTIFAWGGLLLVYILIAWLARHNTYA